MKIYEAEDEEDFMDTLLQTLEQDTGKKIFTMKVIEHTEKGLETLIVFEDKNIMWGIIKVQEIMGKMAIRIQGNYV